ncbi:30S ribosomal protein S16 [Candidatus Peregrinibacteria bacterium]|nr:30S ribosomal protein S16 [Candidatus Peregrinibacteria bacterium]
MLMIRLQRTGRSNLATYRIVVAEKARPVKGKFLAILGHYLPQQNPPVFKLDEAAAVEWIKKGAQPSDTAARLFKKAGMQGMEKFMQRYTKKKPKGEEPAAEVPAAPAASAQTETKPETKQEPAKEEAPKTEEEAPAKEETPPAEPAAA